MTTKNSKSKDATARLLNTSNVLNANPEALADKVTNAVMSTPGYSAKVDSEAQSKPLAATVSAALKYSDMTVSVVSLQKTMESIQKITLDASIGSMLTGGVQIDEKATEEQLTAALEKIIPEMAKLMSAMQKQAQEALPSYKLAQSTSDASTPVGAALGYNATNSAIGTLILAQVGQMMGNMFSVIDQAVQAEKSGKQFEEPDVAKLLGGSGDTEATLKEFKDLRQQLSRFKTALDSFGQQGVEAKEWVEAFSERIARNIAAPQLIKAGLVKSESEYDSMAATLKAQRKQMEANMDQMLDAMEMMLQLGSAAQKGDLDIDSIGGSAPKNKDALSSLFRREEGEKK